MQLGMVMKYITGTFNVFSYRNLSNSKCIDNIFIDNQKQEKMYVGSYLYVIILIGSHAKPQNICNTIYIHFSTDTSYFRFMPTNIVSQHSLSRHVFDWYKKGNWCKTFYIRHFKSIFLSVNRILIQISLQFVPMGIPISWHQCKESCELSTGQVRSLSCHFCLLILFVYHVH